MDFPRTNKISQYIPDKVSENAQLLEGLLNQIHWRRFFNYYCAFFGIFLVSIFLIIVTVKFALWLF